jgi:hypothetical protein
MGAGDCPGPHRFLAREWDTSEDSSTLGCARWASRESQARRALSCGQQVGLPSSGQRTRTWIQSGRHCPAPALPLRSVATRGGCGPEPPQTWRVGKVPTYLRGHKRQIHGVAAVACARVLAAAAAAAAGPAACTAGRERAEQRAGAPRSPRRRRPHQSRRGGASRSRTAPSAASRWRVGGGPERGDGARLQAGSLPRDHSQPHPRGRARRVP